MRDLLVNIKPLQCVLNEFDNVAILSKNHIVSYFWVGLRPVIHALGEKKDNNLHD